MAEFSMLWETQRGVGDGEYTYDQLEANNFYSALFTRTPVTQGVMKGILNELEVSGSTSPLAVATGYGFCHNFMYWADSIQNETVTTPTVGDTGGRIILRANWALNEVRSTALLNTDGNNAIPALTQTAGTTWEIGLASFVIDTSGNIWTDSGKGTAGVTDTRNWAMSGFGGMIPLAEHIGDGSTAFDYRVQPDLTHLMIVGIARASGAPVGHQLRFNNVSTADYGYQYIQGINATVSPLAQSSQTGIVMPWTGASGTANAADAFVIHIPNYANATWYKACTVMTGAFNTGLAATTEIQMLFGWTLKAPAIESIQIAGGGTPFATGSRITIYGMK